MKKEKPSSTSRLQNEIPKHMKKANANEDSRQSQKGEFTPDEIRIPEQSEKDFKYSQDLWQYKLGNDIHVKNWKLQNRRRQKCGKNR